MEVVSLVSRRAATGREAMIRGEITLGKCKLYRRTGFRANQRVAVRSGE